MTLDDRLRQILLALLAVNANGEGSGVSVQLLEEGPHEIDAAITEVLQAFAYEGYTDKPRTVVMTDNARRAANYQPLMTGAEWYSRFNDELKHLISRGDGETWMGWDCGEVQAAAKKAAGL